MSESRGHDDLYGIWLCSGMGPRRKPGEFLSIINPDVRARIIATVNGNSAPAPWVLKAVVSTGR